MATKYVIFAIAEGDKANVPLWRELGEVEAGSTAAAIRNYINGGAGNTLLSPDNGGTYAAVPARSWQPVTVKVETALKFA